MGVEGMKMKGSPSCFCSCGNLLQLPLVSRPRRSAPSQVTWKLERCHGIDAENSLKVWAAAPPDRWSETVRYGVCISRYSPPSKIWKKQPHFTPLEAQTQRSWRKSECQVCDSGGVQFLSVTAAGCQLWPAPLWNCSQRLDRLLPNLFPLASLDNPVFPFCLVEDP